MTPDKHTNQELQLPVGDGHELYVHDWGNKNAQKPILFLHGGPGYGCKDSHKQRFNPEKQRVIFFDQRGCGKSTPSGSLENNTTDHLIEDMRKIIEHFELQNIIITGGSWGSTLALAYALKYPENIHALAISGIYTSTKRENDYLLNGGYKTHYPEVWEKILQNTPKEYHDDPASYHYARILGSDEQAAKESGFFYENTEGAVMSLDDRVSQRSLEEFDPKDIQIETHYLHNQCFLPERYILDNAHKLTIPVWIIQGRFDFVCPPETAYELHKALPNCELIFTQAGHGNDRGTYDVMRTILLQLSKEL